MMWSNHLRDGTHVLNQKAVRIKGVHTSFFIHYWGAISGDCSNKPHQHSFFEACYVVKGDGSYLEGGKTYPLHKGTLFLSRPYITHQILSGPDMDLVFIGFETDQDESKPQSRRLFMELEETSTFVIHEAEDLPLVKLWISLLMLANDVQPLFEDSVAGLGCAVLTGIERQFGEDNHIDQIKQSGRIAATLVYRAKLYIRDNLSQLLKLNEVADYLHISGRHLSRIFQEELGQSYSSYVRKERIRQASILLTDTDLSTKEISERTGFDNVHYFTNVFSAELGMPPGQFKKKFRQLHD